MATLKKNLFFHKPTHFDIKQIAQRYFIALVPILLIVFSLYTYIYELETNQTQALITEKQKQDALMVEYSIQNIFKELYENLLVTKDSSELIAYIENPTDATLYEAEQLFFRLASNKKSFSQIRYINQTGREVIRANNDDAGNTYLSTEKDLQDKSERYYYIEASQLKDGEIYVSNMDLNVEGCKVELPYAPVVRIAAPIYAESGEYKGIIIINYLGVNVIKLLEEQLEENSNQFISPMLLNQDGYFLFHHKSWKCFGFMFESQQDETLAVENSELWSAVQALPSGSFEQGTLLYYYQSIHPLERLNISNNPTYGWYFVSQADLAAMPNFSNQLLFGMELRDFIVLAMVCLLTLVVIIVNYYSKMDREQLSLTNSIAENTNDAVIITDSQTYIIYANPAFEKATGYTRQEVLGLKPSNFKSNKQSIEFYRKMWHSINETGRWHGELWDKKKDGLLYPKQLSILAVKNREGTRVHRYIGIFTDITKLREEEDMIQRLQHYTPDTNLPNETLLLQLINNSIENQAERFYIVYFSVVNYNGMMLKLNNNHQYFVHQLTRRIQRLLKKEDFIAHLTKDSFVIGLLSCKTQGDAEKFLNNLIVENHRPLLADTQDIFYDVKAGLSAYPNDGKNASELTANASLALSNVLQDRNRQYLYYTPSLREALERETEMYMLLRSAIANQELDVYYQPQVDIENDCVVGAEALLRWNNPTLGRVSPAVFIPIAEKTGMIIEIGYWLIDRVFQNYSAIRDTLSETFRISINVSPLQFSQSMLLPKFIELAEKYSINLNQFEIEITENLLMTDIAAVNEKLSALKKLGLTVAIDDFGTGFSSLGYLKNLNIDKLKIDRSFIKDYPEKDKGEIIEVVTNISKKLNLKVLMEGAETPEQIRYLKATGCRLVQGFYYSRPLSHEDFYRFLSQSKL